MALNQTASVGVSAPAPLGAALGVGANSQLLEAQARAKRPVQQAPAQADSAQAPAADSSRTSGGAVRTGAQGLQAPATRHPIRRPPPVIVAPPAPSTPVVPVPSSISGVQQGDPRRGPTPAPTTGEPTPAPGSVTTKGPGPVEGPAATAESANKAFDAALKIRDEIIKEKKAYNHLPGGRSFYLGTANFTQVLQYGKELNRALSLAEQALRSGATREQLADSVSYAQALTAGGIPHRVSPGLFDVSQVLESGEQLDRLKALKKKG